MEGSSKEWKKFAERDRTAAKNFARAATACGVKRIIYLGGLTCAREPDLSEHMRSRAQVGEILKTSTVEVTIFSLRLSWDKVEDDFKCYNIWSKGYQ